MKRTFPFLISAGLLVLHAEARASDAPAGVSPPGLPKGYIVPAETMSPDHVYGITAFDDTVYPVPYETNPNKLVEVKTGRVLVSIEPSGSSQVSGYMTRENHGGIMPTRWSSDEHLALWTVFGKWCPDAMVLLVLKDGKVQQQIDVLKVTQQAILKETKKAALKKYLQARIEDKDGPSAYPDGFTIDVDDIDVPISFPLHVIAVLTSNPKGDEGMTELDSYLSGTIDENGHLKVTSFKLGKISPPHSTWLGK